jgi:hypothetical protein
VLIEQIQIAMPGVEVLRRYALVLAYYEQVHPS